MTINRLRTMSPTQSMTVIIYIMSCIPSFYSQILGDLRLRSRSGSSYFGRLEVSNSSGIWGTVCDDDFDNDDASVACKQLGFSGGVSLQNHVADGSGSIFMDDVACSGSESRLIDCSRSTWGDHNCNHGEDVGIHCFISDSESEENVNGGWGNWLSWSSCSADCGGGIQYRYRKCNNPIPNYGGYYCSGSTVLTQKCNTAKCKVHGQWGSWQSWSKCNSTCGSGTKYRQRQCSNPAPKHGGNNCSGSAIETQTCYSSNCPVDGGWGKWNSWSSCSAICDGGIQYRYRKCNNPIPNYGGNYCLGSPVLTKSCYTAKCRVHGNWGVWLEWGNCTSHCENGTRERTRLCTNPSPANEEMQCIGNAAELETCYQCPEGSSKCGYLEIATAVGAVGSAVFSAVLVAIVFTIWNRKMSRTTREMERENYAHSTINNAYVESTLIDVSTTRNESTIQRPETSQVVTNSALSSDQDDELYVNTALRVVEPTVNTKARSMGAEMHLTAVRPKITTKAPSGGNQKTPKKTREAQEEHVYESLNK